MKRYIIVGVCALLVFVLLFSLTNEVKAWDANISGYDSAGNAGGADTAAQNITGALLIVFRVAAVGIGLIMLVTLAARYMMAAPDGKAEIKKTAAIYIVGAVVLFASAGILTIIQSFATGNISNT